MNIQIVSQSTFSYFDDQAPQFPIPGFRNGGLIRSNSKDKVLLSEKLCFSLMFPNNILTDLKRNGKTFSQMIKAIVTSCSLSDETQTLNIIYTTF